MIAAPLPWPDRAASEASLLEQKPPTLVDGGVPEVVSVGAALRGAFARLGSRAADCQKHGAFTSSGVRVGLMRTVESWTGCPSCLADDLAAKDAAETARRAAERRSRLEDRLARSALPDRFLACSFDNFEADLPEQREALDKVRGFVRDFDLHRRTGTTLVLAGSVGTGKSHLAGAALQAVSDHSLVLYTTLMGVIRMVRDTWRRDSDRTETKVLSELAQVDLLAIDEVGVQYGTDAEKTLLFEILDRRYMDLKPTILLTNLGGQEFKSFVGDRIQDRLRETGIWIPFRWSSYRLRPRAGVAT